MKLSFVLSLLFLFDWQSTPEIIVGEPVKKNGTESLVSDYLNTPNGNKIKYQTNGSIFQLQWYQKGVLKTMEHKFEVNGMEAHKPKFVEENDHYIFLRAGCGNPCWYGFFLPLDNDQSPIIINEYLAYDLDQNLVVYMNYASNQLQILNIKTKAKQKIINPICESAFVGYCIESIFFEKKLLKYKWVPTSNTKKAVWYTAKITI